MTVATMLMLHVVTYVRRHDCGRIWFYQGALLYKIPFYCKPLDWTDLDMMKPLRRNRSKSAMGATDDDDDGPEIDDSCVICGNEESEPFDLIVFCDGCDITVCQSCYSVPTVPEGEWLCRPCAAGARSQARGVDVTCAICERSGGALEPTTCGQWAHTACCQALEEVFFVELGKNAAAANLSKLFPERRQFTCSLCPRRGGTCVVCPRGVCRTAFHPMCAKERARADGLVMYIEELSNGQPVLRMCCAEHSKKLGGVPPKDVRRPKSTRALPSGADGGAPPGAGPAPTEHAEDVAGAAPRVSVSPRVRHDPARPRRKRGRLVEPGRFVEEGIIRPLDTVVLFERKGFERFARETAHLRTLSAVAAVGDTDGHAGSGSGTAAAVVRSISIE